MNKENESTSRPCSLKTFIVATNADPLVRQQVGNGAVGRFCEVTEDPETPHAPAKVLFQNTLLLAFIFVKMVYSMAI